MPADQVVVLPDDVDDETAAALMLKGMTAEYLLHRVASGAGGRHGPRARRRRRRRPAPVPVGAGLGATVIGTVVQQDKARIARDARLRLSDPLHRETISWRRSARSRTGRGCDVVYDAVGRRYLPASYEALAVRGHLVSYGQASGPIPPVDIAAFVGKSARVSRPNFGHYTGTPAEVRAITDRLFDAMRRGIVNVEIGQRFALSDAAEAHRALEARRTNQVEHPAAVGYVRTTDGGRRPFGRRRFGRRRPDGGAPIRRAIAARAEGAAGRDLEGTGSSPGMASRVPRRAGSISGAAASKAAV